LAAPRGKVIEVDFAARRRTRARLDPAPKTPAAAQRFSRIQDFLVFWKPPTGRGTGEYLGGRWEWGWTLFVWTTEAAVGPLLADLIGDRGYVPQRIPREEFHAFLGRATEIGGLLLDGELEEHGEVIRAEPDQMIKRDVAIGALARSRAR
jgi:hypothetical protein